ncbi:MAG: hypothetical protein ACI89Z_000983 [Porticoccus sp.]|jgi:hypothetical protein
MSLIPEKPLIISPSLAATIGLEEAVLLQALNELMCHGEPEANKGFQWLSTNWPQLQKITPFWSLEAIQRIAVSLRDKGVLLIASAPFTECKELRFAFNEQPISSNIQPPIATQRQRTKPLTLDWRPELEVLRQLDQYNIPAEFITDQLPEFITYWTERNEPQFSWGSKFIKHMLRLWRAQQTEAAKRSQQLSMSNDWTPSRDAMEILTRQAGINGNFVEDAIPEFILYWMERGDASNTWNSRFIMHVKRQWARFTATMENDSEPRQLPADWQPSEELYEVLALANINRTFGEQLVPEFILYWRDSGQIYSSWNTKFLQHVKREWSRQQSASSQVITNGQQQRSYRSNSTRSSNLIDELSDRSWAST